jgi:dipeptidase
LIASINIGVVAFTRLNHIYLEAYFIDYTLLVYTSLSAFLTILFTYTTHVSTNTFSPSPTLALHQVAHTYALYEAGYGIMNEKQLAMGESTCASWFYAAPTTAGGKARVEVRELSKIALERTSNARDAIQMMGDLATDLGYYSADWAGGDMSRGEGGEALTVIDTEEAWVFHVTSDDTGTSAVWAAQRVPEGEVSEINNEDRVH